MKTQYYILQKFFYYNNSLFAPKDGPLTDYNENKLLFDSKQEAEEHLFNLGIDNNYKGSIYTSSGRYTLNHNEYDRPDYQIRKVRQ
mgnify:CR=1 FL=1|tara:strand:- start:780 stop:1037 length:258 start_codon:yes stop_codon:yes gene_type:complete